MRRDDRNDPFDDIFREIERMMNDVMGGGVEVNDAGFGSDTHVDIHETDEEIRVIADLPGVEKEDIGLTCDGKALTISAANDRREYDERVTLPGQVDEHSARATYNNGILEVVLARADGSAAIDVD
ncbi:Hsp20/alpha crystallin family protein [Halalkalicoccus subterraneus]|uniref:Hsp20/alpha crystallin family protein n=1 Tax=Halalkalicoccus subterraneus TaxID=2675002 RepID=UPI000EFD4BF5|nr:Hsp20/alpha crystallin family protein [Halalkalicoccus subterraneus]